MSGFLQRVLVSSSGSALPEWVLMQLIGWIVAVFFFVPWSVNIVHIIFIVFSLVFSLVLSMLYVCFVCRPVVSETKALRNALVRGVDALWAKQESRIIRIGGAANDSDEAEGTLGHMTGATGIHGVRQQQQQSSGPLANRSKNNTNNNNSNNNNIVDESSGGGGCLGLCCCSSTNQTSDAVVLHHSQGKKDSRSYSDSTNNSASTTNGSSNGDSNLCSSHNASVEQRVQKALRIIQERACRSCGHDQNGSSSSIAKEALTSVGFLRTHSWKRSFVSQTLLTLQLLILGVMVLESPDVMSIYTQISLSKGNEMLDFNAYDTRGGGGNSVSTSVTRNASIRNELVILNRAIIERDDAARVRFRAHTYPESIVWKLCFVHIWFVFALNVAWLPSFIVGLIHFAILFAHYDRLEAATMMFSAVWLMVPFIGAIAAGITAIVNHKKQRRNGAARNSKDGEENNNNNNNNIDNDDDGEQKELEVVSGNVHPSMPVSTFVPTQTHRYEELDMELDLPRGANTKANDAARNPRSSEERANEARLRNGDSSSASDEIQTVPMTLDRHLQNTPRHRNGCASTASVLFLPIACYTPSMWTMCFRNHEGLSCDTAPAKVERNGARYPMNTSASKHVHGKRTASENGINAHVVDWGDHLMLAIPLPSRKTAAHALVEQDSLPNDSGVVHPASAHPFETEAFAGATNYSSHQNNATSAAGTGLKLKECIVEECEGSPLPCIALTSNKTVCAVSASFLSLCGLSKSQMMARKFEDVLRDLQVKSPTNALRAMDDARANLEKRREILSKQNYVVLRGVRSDGTSGDARHDRTNGALTDGFAVTLSVLALRPLIGGGGGGKGGLPKNQRSDAPAFVLTQLPAHVFVDNLAIAAFLVDRHSGEVQHWNQAARQMTECTTSEMIGWPAYDHIFIPNSMVVAHRRGQDNTNTNNNAHGRGKSLGGLFTRGRSSVQETNDPHHHVSMSEDRRRQNGNRNGKNTQQSSEADQQPLDGLVQIPMSDVSRGNNADALSTPATPLSRNRKNKTGAKENRQDDSHATDNDDENDATLTHSRRGRHSTSTQAPSPSPLRPEDFDDTRGALENENSFEAGRGTNPNNNNNTNGSVVVEIGDGSPNNKNKVRSPTASTAAPKTWDMIRNRLFSRSANREDDSRKNTATFRKRKDGAAIPTAANGEGGGDGNGAPIPHSGAPRWFRCTMLRLSESDVARMMVDTLPAANSMMVAAMQERVNTLGRASVGSLDDDGGEFSPASARHSLSLLTRNSLSPESGCGFSKNQDRSYLLVLLHGDPLYDDSNSGVEGARWQGVRDELRSLVGSLVPPKYIAAAASQLAGVAPRNRMAGGVSEELLGQLREVSHMLNAVLLLAGDKSAGNAVVPLQSEEIAGAPREADGDGADIGRNHHPALDRRANGPSSIGEVLPNISGEALGYAWPVQGGVRRTSDQGRGGYAPSPTAPDGAFKSQPHQRGPHSKEAYAGDEYAGAGMASMRQMDDEYMHDRVIHGRKGTRVGYSLTPLSHQQMQNGDPYRNDSFPNSNYNHNNSNNGYERAYHDQEHTQVSHEKPDGRIGDDRRENVVELLPDDYFQQLEKQRQSSNKREFYDANNSTQHPHRYPVDSSRRPARRSSVPLDGGYSGLDSSVGIDGEDDMDTGYDTHATNESVSAGEQVVRNSDPYFAGGGNGSGILPPTRRHTPSERKLNSVYADDEVRYVAEERFLLDALQQDGRTDHRNPHLASSGPPSPPQRAAPVGVSASGSGYAVGDGVQNVYDDSEPLLDGKQQPYLEGHTSRNGPLRSPPKDTTTSSGAADGGNSPHMYAQPPQAVSSLRTPEYNASSSRQRGYQNTQRTSLRSPSTQKEIYERRRSSRQKVKAAVDHSVSNDPDALVNGRTSFSSPEGPNTPSTAHPSHAGATALSDQENGCDWEFARPGESPVVPSLTIRRPTGPVANNSFATEHQLSRSVDGPVQRVPGNVSRLARSQDDFVHTRTQHHRSRNASIGSERARRAAAAQGKLPPTSTGSVGRLTPVAGSGTPRTRMRASSGGVVWAPSSFSEASNNESFMEESCLSSPTQFLPAMEPRDSLDKIAQPSQSGVSMDDVEGGTESRDPRRWFPRTISSSANPSIPTTSVASSVNGMSPIAPRAHETIALSSSTPVSRSAKGMQQQMMSMTSKGEFGGNGAPRTADGHGTGDASARSTDSEVIWGALVSHDEKLIPSCYMVGYRNSGAKKSGDNSFPLDREIGADDPEDVDDFRTTEFRFGRSSTCHLIATDTFVSSSQFTITREKRTAENTATAIGASVSDGGERYIVLLHDRSANGTYVNVKRVGKGRTAELQHMTAITFRLNTSRFFLGFVFVLAKHARREDGRLIAPEELIPYYKSRISQPTRSSPRPITSTYASRPGMNGDADAESERSDHNQRLLTPPSNSLSPEASGQRGRPAARENHAASEREDGNSVTYSDDEENENGSNPESDNAEESESDVERSDADTNGRVPKDSRPPGGRRSHNTSTAHGRKRQQTGQTSKHRSSSGRYRAGGGGKGNKSPRAGQRLSNRASGGGGLTGSRSQHAAQRETIEWKIGEEMLGKGGNAEVYLGINLTNGKLIAVKRVMLPNAVESPPTAGLSSFNQGETGTSEEAANSRQQQAILKQYRSLQEEINVLSKAAHPNIVRYLGSSTNKKYFNILLEFVPGGSLRHLLDNFGSLSDGVTLSYLKQVLNGLTYLHDHGFVHGDLKAANILVADTGRVKLSDFGTARLLRGGGNGGGATGASGGVTSPGERDAQGEPLGMHTGVHAHSHIHVAGTLRWMAPELFRDNNNNNNNMVVSQTESPDGTVAQQFTQIATKASDIWSLGCVLIEMLTAEAPWSEYEFESEEQIINLLMYTTAPPDLPEADEDGVDDTTNAAAAAAAAEGGKRSKHNRDIIHMARLCLDLDPSKRPTSRNLLAMVSEAEEELRVKDAAEAEAMEYDA